MVSKSSNGSKNGNDSFNQFIMKVFNLIEIYEQDHIKTTFLAIFKPN